MAQITVKNAAGTDVAVELPNPNGQTTMANSRSVTIASDQSPIVLAGLSTRVSGSFSRPADTVAYASGDLVANSTTAGSVVPVSLSVARVNGGSGYITRAHLSTSKTGLLGADQFRLHLFTTSPTVANGDNGVFSANGNAAGYLGAFEIVLNRIFSDGARGVAAPDVGSALMFVAGGATTNVFALLESRNASYTPSNGEIFTITLEVTRD